MKAISRGAESQREGWDAKGKPIYHRSEGRPTGGKHYKEEGEHLIVGGCKLVGWMENRRSELLPTPDPQVVLF